MAAEIATVTEVDAVDGPTITEDANHGSDANAEELLVGDVLVEEISIDGMCGVY
jgi:mycofactocin precursor